MSKGICEIWNTLFKLWYHFVPVITLFRRADFTGWYSLCPKLFATFALSKRPRREWGSLTEMELTKKKIGKLWDLFTIYGNIYKNQGESDDKFVNKVWDLYTIYENIYKCCK